MTRETKTVLIEHLGRRHQAMVTLLAELVGIDSGSYNKRGVDAVADRLRAWLEAAGLPARHSQTRVSAAACWRGFRRPAATARSF